MGVAVDAAGDLFVAEEYYDPESCDTVYRFRKVTPDGIINTLPPLPNCCYAGIAADSAGNVIVPASNVIWKMSPTGAQTTIAGNGTFGQPSGDGGPAAKAQLNGVTAVAVGPAGDLFIADNAGRNVRRVTSDGIIRTFATIPSAAQPSSGDGGPAVGAQLQLSVQGLSIQSGLATDSSGNLYIAETGANRVRKVSPSGTITTIAGVGQLSCSSKSISSPSCLPLGDGGPATSASLALPTSVAVDSAGNLFIADASDLRVRKVSPDGTITTVAGNGNSPVWPGGAGDGGPAVNTPIVPYVVAVDPAGNVFIEEGNFADIRKVSPDGTISTVVSPNTAPPNFGSNGAMTVDRAGNLYVGGSGCSDDITCYSAIQKISPSGDITLLAGGPNNAYSPQPGSSNGDGGPAINVPIGFVSGLAVDSSGNLFLADLIGQRIRKIDTNGIITTVGGDGVPGYSGDGGPATNATVNYPFGLAADAAGNVYVSDLNQAVRILRPSSQSQ